MNTKVEFLGAFAGGRLPEHGYPEIAVAGRSNVGKSSFINRVLGVRGLARVSSRPGKTTTINFYLYNRRFVLADLPGYGYSKASGAERTRWAHDVQSYLSGSSSLRGLVQIADIRHFPMAIDSEAMEWFRTAGVALLLVATKADKLSRSDLGRQERIVAGMCGRQDVDFVVFSAETGVGKHDIWKWIDRLVER